MGKITNVFMLMAVSVIITYSVLWLIPIERISPNVIGLIIGISTSAGWIVAQFISTLDKNKER